MSQSGMPLWQVSINQQIYEADTATLRNWMREGRVLPTDLVKFGAGDWMPVAQVPQFRVTPPAAVSFQAPQPMPQPVPERKSAPAFVPPPFAAPASNFREPLVFSQPAGMMMGLIATTLLLLTTFAPVVRSTDWSGRVQLHWSFDFLLGKLLVLIVIGALTVSFSPARPVLAVLGVIVVVLGLLHLYRLTTPPDQMDMFVKEFADIANLKVSRPQLREVWTYWPTLLAITSSGIFMILAGLVQVPGEGLLLANLSLRYAGFWERLFAAVLDLFWLVFGGTTAFIILLTFLAQNQGMFSVLEKGYLVLAFLGGVVLVSLVIGLVIQMEYAGTPGQMSRRIVILDATARRKVKMGRILLRAFASLLSALPLGLGFFWSAFDKKKQTWHDKLAGTVVVYLD